MITKSRNSRLTGVKFVLTLSVLASFTWLVSCQDATKNNDTNTVNVISPKPIDSSGLRNSESTPADETEVYVVAENMPKYKGGDEAMIKFISENIKYPGKAKENGVQGTVYVTFIIGTDGAVSEAKVLRGIGSGCDEEALRVVKMMPKWTPGNQSGKNVKVSLNLPVKFALQ